MLDFWLNLPSEVRWALVIVIGGAFCYGVAALVERLERQPHGPMSEHELQRLRRDQFARERRNRLALSQRGRNGGDAA